MCQFLQPKACLSFRPHAPQALAWSLASVIRPGVSGLAPLGSLDEHPAAYEDGGCDSRELLPTARVICTNLSACLPSSGVWAIPTLVGNSGGYVQPASEQPQQLSPANLAAP